MDPIVLSLSGTMVSVGDLGSHQAQALLCCQGPCRLFSPARQALAGSPWPLLSWQNEAMCAVFSTASGMC